MITQDQAFLRTTRRLLFNAFGQQGLPTFLGFGGDDNGNTATGEHNESLHQLVWRPQ
jgi:hypothetical protein